MDLVGFYDFEALGMPAEASHDPRYMNDMEICNSRDI
jgi:hypothetical protein